MEKYTYFPPYTPAEQVDFLWLLCSLLGPCTTLIIVLGQQTIYTPPKKKRP